MASGIEIRVPFLDHEVIEFAYSLPARLLIRDGVQKSLPKQLLHRFCGLEYRSTSKLFVATPQREWIKGPLFDEILRYLDHGALAQSGLVDFDKFRGAYRSYAGQRDLGNSFFVWQMVNLEALLRRFFPGFARP